LIAEVNWLLCQVVIVQQACDRVIRFPGLGPLYYPFTSRGRVDHALLCVLHASVDLHVVHLVNHKNAVNVGRQNLFAKRIEERPTGETHRIKWNLVLLVGVHC
jgi:hypothetical protein